MRIRNNRTTKAKEEKNEIDKINFEKSYKNTLFEIKDLEKQLYYLMGYRNTLIKKNFLIKRLNELNNNILDILRIKLFHWHSYCIICRAHENWIKLSNLIRLYFKINVLAIIREILKNRKLFQKGINIFVNLMNYLDYKNKLFFLKNFFFRLINIVNDLKVREKKLNDAINLIEEKEVFLDIVTMGNIFNKKKEIDNEKSEKYKSRFYLGIIIMKRIINDYIKKNFNYFIKNEANLIIEELDNKIIQYEELSDGNNALKIIASKDKEIETLKQSLSRFPFQLSKNEQLMSVIFQSNNQEIHNSIICKNTDHFTTIVNLLYDKFPKYRKIECFFLFNGKKINEYNTLKELNIKDGDVIMLNKYE